MLIHPPKKPEKCRVCDEDLRRTKELERIILRIDEISSLLAAVIKFENEEKREFVLELWGKYVNEDGDYVDLLRSFNIKE